jgi:stage II sporulation protein P
MRGRKTLKKILMCGMVIFTLPLFFVSLKEKMPSVSETMLIAAEEAAGMALTTMYSNEADRETALFGETGDYTEALAETSASSEKTTLATPLQAGACLRITTDDSEMLSKTDIRVMPSSEDEEGFIPEPPQSEENSDTPDYSDLDGIVSEVTFGNMNGTNYINLPAGGQIRNLTDLENSEIENIISGSSLKLRADGSPEVLIYHTHATECYLPEGMGDKYDTDYIFRSSDTSINMVSVGNAIKKELEAAGIGVIHDETLYDEESYNGSYDKSRAGVSEILKNNPGIVLVLDVHRDGITRSDSEIVSAVTEVDGKSAAQIMIISNCNGDTLKYPIPHYRENLKTAAALNNALCTDSPGLCRPILFDYRQYNQDLSPGALLIEIGSHGNTLEEAKYAGELLGKAIASLSES